MKKFDYISILAGGSCKFNCSFCVGNDMRKNITPHYSKKWKSFIECYADMTNLLSISGDTSDPSFVEDTWEMAEYAKEYNPDIRVTLHTRNIDVLEKCFVDNCFDKFVFSIDENITLDVLKKLKNYKNKVRLSFVITKDNFWIIDEWNEHLSEIYDFQMTIRPDINETDSDWKDTFFIKFNYIMDKKNTVVQKENGAISLREYSNIWFWDYTITNPMINSLYLFSDGTISDNCKWSKIIEEK
jgi:sulfatase maturation enzyme AslB (radical SAM superfamily)